MSVSHTHSPSKGINRRVLGELASKALNTPARRESFEAARAQSPLKHMQTLSPQLFGGKENALASTPKGKKRTIYDVDDAERVQDAKVRVGGSTAAKVGPSAAAVRIHTDNTAVDVPVPASPTERNTPTPEPQPVPEPEALNSQDTQGSNQSFSKWIEYGLCASQNSVQPVPSRAPSPPSPPEESKSKADLLRTRLGFGIYKIKTNQVAKCTKDIISSWESSLTNSTTDASASITVTSSGELRDDPVSNTIASPIRCDFQPVFVKANLDPFQPIANLNLTPAPLLLPTATSSHILRDYPSSPPQAVSPEQLMSPAKQQPNYTTPQNQSPDFKPTRPEDRESRDGSGVKHRQRFQESDLTSPAIKGNAAQGLIQLMGGKR